MVGSDPIDRVKQNEAEEIENVWILGLYRAQWPFFFFFVEEVSIYDIFMRLNARDFFSVFLSRSKTRDVPKKTRRPISLTIEMAQQTHEML